MALRKQTQTVTRLTFGSDWIDVRERVYGDNVAASQAATAEGARLMAQGEAKGKNAKNVRRIGSNAFDLSTFNLVILERSIVAWSDVDDQGNMVPINRETIQQLDADIAQEVLAHVLGGEDDEEEAENPLEKTSTSVSEPVKESGSSEEKALLDGQES